MPASGRCLYCQRIRRIPKLLRCADVLFPHSTRMQGVALLVFPSEGSGVRCRAFVNAAVLRVYRLHCAQTDGQKAVYSDRDERCWFSHWPLTDPTSGFLSRAKARSTCLPTSMPMSRTRGTTTMRLSIVRGMCSL